MVAFLKKEFDVVRVKNRFEEDAIEEVSSERILAEFHSAETLSEEAPLLRESASKSDKMYRDILVNLRPKGSDFICEVQLTLTGIAILKKSEQKIYTLARMTSAEELADTFVFSKPRELSGRDPGAVRAEVFDHEDLAFAIDLPELQEEKGAQRLNSKSTTATQHSIGAAGQSANADVSEMIRDDLHARRIERLEYELRSARAANETLKGEVEQLETALSVVAGSSAHAVPPLVTSLVSSNNMRDYNGGVEGSGRGDTTFSA
jgi:hypothetical protein